MVVVQLELLVCLSLYIDIKVNENREACVSSLIPVTLYPFARYNRLLNRFQNRLDVCLHDTAVCQTG